MESSNTEEAVKKVILDAIEELTQKGCTREDIKHYIQQQGDSAISDDIVEKVLENLVSTGSLQTNGDRFYLSEAERVDAPHDCPSCQAKKRKRCQRRRSCPPKCKKPCPKRCPKPCPKPCAKPCPTCPKPCARCASDSEVSSSGEEDSGSDYTSDDVHDAIVELVQGGGVRGCTMTDIKKHLQKEGVNVSGEELHAVLDSLVEQKRLQLQNRRYTIKPDDDAEEESSGGEQECPSCQKKRACRKKQPCKRKPRCPRKKICSRSWCDKPKRGCKTGCPQCSEGQPQCESDSGSETDS